MKRPILMLILMAAVTAAIILLAPEDKDPELDTQQQGETPGPTGSLSAPRTTIGGPQSTIPKA